MHNSSWLKRQGPFLLAGVLALGCAAAWAVTIVWLSAAGMSQQRDESLEITRDGTAIIREFHRAGGATVYAFRNLAGQEIADPPWQTAALEVIEPRQRKTLSVGWDQRITQVADTQPWPTIWYLITDREMPGSAYFVLYDSRTKELAGYFGPGGFRPDLPPEEERFADVPLAGIAAVEAFVQSGLAVGTRASTVYLISAGKLLAINLERRTMSTVELPGEAVSVVWATQYDPDESGGELPYRAVVRTPDQILLLDKNNAIFRSGTLPAEIRERSLMIFHCRVPEIVLVAGDNDRPGLSEVYWLGGSAGDRHETARLHLTSADNHWMIGWYIAAIVPSPVLECLVHFLEANQNVNSGKAATIGESLARTFTRDWPALVAVVVLSAVLAVVCYRRQRRYGADSATAWAVFVLFAGAPGLLGYWLHRRWPATEQCEQCGATVPRDRENCLDCATEFPAPRRQGIEVFA